MTATARQPLEVLPVLAGKAAALDAPGRLIARTVFETRIRAGRVEVRLPGGDA